jgi:drug/metabolite transporter (DMT)-like permease
MQSLARTLFGRLFDAPYTLLSLTSLFWAGNIVLGRYAAGHIPPVALSFFRWGGAFLILIAFAIPALRRDWATIRNHLGVLLILSFTGIALYNTLGYWGLEYTQALNALLITSVHPLLVALWSFILYRERLTHWQSLGIALSLLGVLVVLTRGDLAVLRDIRVNFGDILFVIAQTIYAFYTAFLKKRPDIEPLSFLAFTLGAGALMLSPVYAAEVASGRTFTLDLKAILILGYIAVLPSLVAYLFFNRGVQLIGPNRAAPFYHLIPVFGSVLAIAFLGERPELFHAVGYSLVLVGIYTGTRGQAGPAQQQPPPAR